MASKVKATPFPPELPRSGDYRLFVNGEPVDAIEVPKPQEMLAEEQRFAYSFATFDIDGEASIEVEAIGPGLVMRDPAVLPARIGAKPELIAPDRARFAVSGPCRIVFEADGRHRALVIAIHQTENGAPRIAALHPSPSLPSPFARRACRRRTKRIPLSPRCCF